jgi:twinkle protein
MTVSKLYDSFAAARIDFAGTGDDDTVTIACPECSQARKKQGTRSLRVTRSSGLWTCYHCQWSGAIRKGPAPRDLRIYNRPTITFKSELPQTVIKYLVEERGLDPKVLRPEIISYCPSRKKIMFIYRKGGEIVNLRYRDRQKRYSQEENCEHVLWDIDQVTKGCELVVYEGEPDKLTGDLVDPDRVHVSVPNGSNSYQFLKSSGKALDLADKIILAGDMDEPGRKMVEELARRIGKDKCYKVTWPNDCNDANETLLKFGREKVTECLDHAQPWPIEGVHSPKEYLGELQEMYRHGVKQGVDPGMGLGRKMRISPGCLSIGTAIPNHGKSTLLNNIMCNIARSAGWAFAVFSPEYASPKHHVRNLIQIWTGKPFMEGSANRMSEDEAVIAIRNINEHFHFILPEEAAPDIDSILSRAKQLIRQKDQVRGLVIDPWNKLEASRKPTQSETEYVAETLNKLAYFAKMYGIHVGLCGPKTLGYFRQRPLL